MCRFTQNVLLLKIRKRIKQTNEETKFHAPQKKYLQRRSPKQGDGCRIPCVEKELFFLLGAWTPGTSVSLCQGHLWKQVGTLHAKNLAGCKGEFACLFPELLRCTKKAKVISKKCKGIFLFWGLTALALMPPGCSYSSFRHYDNNRPNKLYSQHYTA